MSQPDIEIDSPRPTQVSIANMMWWVTMAALACATFAYLVRSRGNALPLHQIIVAVLAWIVFLVHYVRSRSYAAIVIHVVPLIFIVVFSFMLSQVEGSSFPLMMIAITTMVCSMALSIVIGLEFTVSNTINKNANPKLYLLYRVAGGTVLMAVVCSLWPSFIRRGVDFPSLLLGAQLGFWGGLYQGIVTSEQLKKWRIFDVPIRMIVTTGFLAAMAGPILLAYTNPTLLLPFIPVCYGPLLGFVMTAILIGLWRAVVPIFGRTKTS